MNLYLVALGVTVLALAPLVRRPSVLLGVLPQLGLVLVGVARLHEVGAASAGAFWALAAGVLALTAGHLVGRRTAPDTRPVAATRPVHQAFVRGCVAVTTAGTALHFALGGIPLLRADVEVSRFAFDSGLFGVPGRLFLLGTIVSVALACADANSRGVRWRSDGAAATALTVLVVSRLLAGFKSGLLEVAFVLLLVLVLTGTRTTSVGTVLRRHWTLALPVGGYVLLVAGRYATYTSSGQQATSALWDRLTTVGAQPAVAVLDRLVPRPSGWLPWTDLQYFLLHYTGGDTTGRFTFERLVSASLLGQDPAWAVYAPPVTVGGFAELAVALGLPLALGLCALAGAWLARAERVPARDSLTLGLRVVGTYVLCSVVLKGGVVYGLVNGLATVALVLLAGVAGLAVHRAFAPRGVAPTLVGAR